LERSDRFDDFVLGHIGDEESAVSIVRFRVRTSTSDLGGYCSFSNVMDPSLFGRELYPKLQ
jgi:hypothetical protein